MEPKKRLKHGSLNKGTEEESKKTLVIPSAELLATLGTHRRDRPMSPLEVALKLKDELKRGVRREQYPVDDDTINMFLSLPSLPKSIKKKLGFGGVRKGEIGSYAGYRISTLKKDEDKETLGKATLEKKLSSKEVGRIVRYKKRLKEKPIEDCIASVIEMRPKKRHIFIGQLSEDILKRLEERVASTGINLEDLLRRTLSTNFPESSLISISLKEDFITLFLNEWGEKALRKKAKELSVPFKDIVGTIISKEL